ncbi:TPA: lipopolysaccharide biosynthesis protein [Serratia fonticola]
MNGSIVNIACQFLKLGFQFLYFTIAARMLGGDKFGLWASISALCNILSPLIILGIGPCIIKIYASKKDYGLFRSYYYLGFFLLLLGSFSLIPIAKLLYSANVITITQILISELLVFRLVELLSQMYLAKGNKIAFSIFPVVFVVFKLTFVFSASGMGLSTDFIYMNFLSSLMFIIPIFIWEEIRSVRIGLKVQLVRSIKIIRESVYFSLATTAKTVYTDSDKVIMGAANNLKDVASYNIAYKLISLVFVPVSAILSIQAPTLYYLGSLEDKAQLKNKIIKLIMICVAISTLVGVVIIILLPFVINVFGHEYANAKNMVYLLLPAPIIMSMHYVFADGITAMGFQKLRAYLSIVTAVANAILGLIFIPLYGVIGAVCVTLLSETLLLMLFSSVFISKLKKSSYAKS